MDFALPLVILVMIVFIILNRQKAKKLAEENQQLVQRFWLRTHRKMG